MIAFWGLPGDWGLPDVAQGRQKTYETHLKMLSKLVVYILERAFTTQTAGLSIDPFNGESLHMGKPLFNHGRIAMLTLEDISKRFPNTSLDQIIARPSKRAQSELSLTLGDRSPDVSICEARTTNRDKWRAGFENFM